MDFWTFLWGPPRPPNHYIHSVWTAMCHQTIIFVAFGAGHQTHFRTTTGHRVRIPCICLRLPTRYGSNPYDIRLLNAILEFLDVWSGPPIELPPNHYICSIWAAMCHQTIIFVVSEAGHRSGDHQTIIFTPFERRCATKPLYLYRLGRATKRTFGQPLATETEFLAFAYVCLLKSKKQQNSK